MARWYEGYKAPDVPHCLLWKISWGVLQVVKVPEDRAHVYLDQRNGWRLLIGDSEFPVETGFLDWGSDHSNPRRHDDADGA